MLYRAAAGIPASTVTEQVATRILLDLRLPRLLFAALVGASFAGAGVVLQSLFRNPLADPMLTGISAGAASSAIVIIVLGWSHVTVMQFSVLPLAAFLGGLLVVWVIHRMARRDGQTDMLFLLLTGIAVNTLAAGVIGFFTVVAGSEALRSFTFWMLGSFANISWFEVLSSAALILPAWLVMVLARKPLNLFVLGERNAAYLGLRVERWKRLLLVAVALCVGVSVALAGMIAFIGLITPHLIRLAYGSDHRVLVPASMLGGAGLAVLSDVVARTVFPPLELPITAVTALIGVPLFFFLMFSGRFSQRY